jgi:hypothetical protein
MYVRTDLVLHNIPRKITESNDGLKKDISEKEYSMRYQQTPVEEQVNKDTFIQCICCQYS